MNLWPLSLTSLFVRKLEGDVVVMNDDWLKQSGLQQQLEFEGYQLRWVTSERMDLNLADGWQFATVPYLFWWHRRVRRRQGPSNQFLLKRIKSFRSRGFG